MSSFGQLLADGAQSAVLAIARRAGLPDAEAVTSQAAKAAIICQNCYPSLYLLPGSMRTGHFFAVSRPLHRQSLVCEGGNYQLPFRRRQKPVRVSGTITLTRGSQTCAKSFFSPLFPPRLPLALQTTASAPLSARHPARHLPLRPMAMCLPVQSLAALLVRSATKSPTSAADPNAAALHDERPFGAIPRVAVFLLPARPRRARCSRRS